ncbi:MAG: hypothetical protein JXX14_10265 [Deltaproteobacteria bacterium]|nr:hypothetical protein [Deltaproteobacteria bacterium]
MSQKTLKKIDLLLILYAVILCFGAFFFYDNRSLLSVAAGAAVAFVNWVLSRRLGVKLIFGEHQQRVAILLSIKMLVVIGVIVSILAFTPVEPVAFMIGLSVLVMGILTQGIREIFIQ